MRQERLREGPPGARHTQNKNAVNGNRGEFRIRQGVLGVRDLFLPYPTPVFGSGFWMRSDWSPNAISDDDICH